MAAVHREAVVGEMAGSRLRPIATRMVSWAEARDAFADIKVLGLAIDGPLAGERLSAILHTNTFWFAWAAFNPDTRIVTAEP